MVGGLWTGTDRSVAHRRRPAQDIVPLITYGELDGVAHPFVGLMVADDADGNPMWRCSGALISPTLFLTAGHCTDGAAPVTSFALNGNCAGTGSGYRVDQADDLDWLSSLPH